MDLPPDPSWLNRPCAWLVQPRVGRPWAGQGTLCAVARSDDGWTLRYRPFRASLERTVFMNADAPLALWAHRDVFFRQTYVHVGRASEFFFHVVRDFTSACALASTPPDALFGKPRRAPPLFARDPETGENADLAPHEPCWIAWVADPIERAVPERAFERAYFSRASAEAAAQVILRQRGYGWPFLAERVSARDGVEVWGDPERLPDGRDSRDGP